MFAVMNTRVFHGNWRLHGSSDSAATTIACTWHRLLFYPGAPLLLATSTFNRMTQQYVGSKQALQAKWEGERGISQGLIMVNSQTLLWYPSGKSQYSATGGNTVLFVTGKPSVCVQGHVY